MSEPDYTFEIWKQRSGRGLPYSTIGISKIGNITLSDDLFDKYFSLEYSTVEIFIDAKLRVIGLKPSNEKENGMPFHKIGHVNKAKVLFTRKLVLFNDIEPRQYIGHWSDKYKMVIFNYNRLSEVKQE